jgi:hypothetical protein
MRATLALGFLAVASSLGVAWSPALAQDAGAPLEIGRGLVDGYLGGAAWPSGERDPHLPGNPEGWTVHLVPATHPTTELTRPAGVWFLPPEDGRYLVWLEGHGAITRQTVMGFALRKAGEHDRGAGAVLPPGDPAGTVALPPGVALARHQVLRLLGTTRGFSRQAVGDAATDGVLMPQGEVVASIFDEEKQEYVALGRPIPVKAGAAVWVAPVPPAPGHSELFAKVTFDGGLRDSGGAPCVAARLASGGEPAADFTIRGPFHLYGYWYDLPAGVVTVSPDSPCTHAEPATATLASGGVGSVEVHCAAPPRPDPKIVLQPVD